jgi:hypothetical protein
MELRRGHRACNWLNSNRGDVARDRIRTADTRIFSPHIVARLCVTIGRYWYLFKRLMAVSACRFYRFEHIVTYSSGNVVAKSRHNSDRSPWPVISIRLEFSLAAASSSTLKSPAPTELPDDPDQVEVGAGLRVNTRAAVEFDRVVPVNRQGQGKTHAGVRAGFAFFPVDGRAPAGIIETIEPHPHP